MNPKKTYENLFTGIERLAMKKTFENLLIALMEGEPEGGAVPQSLTDAYAAALPNGKDDNRDERGCAP